MEDGERTRHACRFPRPRGKLSAHKSVSNVRGSSVFQRCWTRGASSHTRGGCAPHPQSSIFHHRFISQPPYDILTRQLYAFSPMDLDCVVPAARGGRVVPLVRKSPGSPLADEAVPRSRKRPRRPVPPRPWPRPNPSPSFRPITFGPPPPPGPGPTNSAIACPTRPGPSAN